MTIAETMKARLVNAGMFESDAATIMEDARSNEALEAMEQRWDDHTEGYPTSVLAATWCSVKELALAWIDEHCPKAWYRADVADS